MTLKDSQRAAFEASMKEEFGDEWPTEAFDRNLGAYPFGPDNARWEGFQAALASPEVKALRRQVRALSNLVEELAEHNTHKTEYDGRMYSICNGCFAQDDAAHSPGCLYIRARAALRAAADTLIQDTQ